MSTTITRAAKGNREALTALYESNRQRVFALSQAILCRKEAAGNVTVWAFKGAWKPVLDGTIASEEAFASFVLQKAIGHCKKQLLKQSSRALKVPVNMNFLIRQIEMGDLPEDASSLETVLSCLPPLQRMILVLNRGAGYSVEEIASAVGIDRAAVQAAIQAEQANLAYIFDAVQKAGGSALPISENQLTHAFEEAQSKCSIPEEAERQITASIDAIAAPVEARQKQQRRRILTVCIAACLVLLLAGVGVGFATGVISIGSSTEESSDSEDTDETEDSEDSDSTEDTETTEDSDTTEDTTEETTDDTASTEETTDETASTEETTDETAEAEETSSSSEDVATVENVSYYADITIEDYGTITVALDAEAAPITVANFVELAESGFYDGLTFHRIIEGFMMQGGDPNGDGTGGSDETIVGEFTDNGYENDLSHTRGAISMARSSDYDSASSQFFIVQEDSTSLDGQYAVFGYVTDGMDIVDAICADAEPTDDNGTIEAEDQPVITSIVIREPEEE